MSNYQVSAEHAAELKAMSRRMHEIAKEDGMASIYITGYPFAEDVPYVNIHAVHGLSPQGSEVRFSGSSKFHYWRRDGIEYCSAEREKS